MSEPRISISESDLHLSSEDRFDRFRLIGWWDQERLAKSRVLVIGASALGNEIIKNLAMLGVGNLFITDLDRIENSNLSRSILYREADNGLGKAEVAARGTRYLPAKSCIFTTAMSFMTWALACFDGQT